MHKELEAYTWQVMVPDIEEESAVELNRRQFVLNWVPFLENVRHFSADLYQQSLDSSVIHVPENFLEAVEGSLVYLKNSYGLEFHIQESSDSLILESRFCPLVSVLESYGFEHEMARKTLCWHCSNFHFFRRLKFIGITGNLQLYPHSCLYQIPKPQEENVNPLFY